MLEIVTSSSTMNASAGALPREMRALVATPEGPRLMRTAAPAAPAAGQVLIRVRLVGICRTDLYVLDGRLGRARISGHEFVGDVVAAGAGVGDLFPGQRVTATPLVPAPVSVSTAGGEPGETRGDASVLGVDRDGAFAEYLCLPRETLFVVPDSMPDELAAYVEPVAAALAVEGVATSSRERLLLWGDGRIAELTERVLRLRPGLRLERASTPDELERDAFDVIVETGVDEAALAALVGALRPRGRLVLKSRPASPVAFALREAVEKELGIQCLRYGDFARAIGLLAGGRLRVGDLIGPVFDLGDFAPALALARRGEARKIFLRMGAV